jgi:hypothetical protein
MRSLKAQRPALRTEVDELSSDFIRLNAASPPVPVPPGHVGPVMLPGTGRMV